MATETVCVTFQDGLDAHNRNMPGHPLKRYAYFNLLNGLKKGDKVVVGTQHGYAVATYEGIATADEAVHANNYIISIVDPAAIEEMKEEHELETQLDEMVQREVYKATRFAQAKQYALEGNEDIQKMLDKMGIEWRVEK